MQHQAAKSEQSQSNEQNGGSTVAQSSSTRKEGAVESNHNRKTGMVLPFEPYSITFDDITYSVDMPQVWINT